MDSLKYKKKENLHSHILYQPINKKITKQYKKLNVIIIVWLIIGLLITVYDYLCISSSLSSGFGTDYSFFSSLMYNLAAAFLGGSIGGMWLIFYVNEKSRGKSYGYSILLVSISFIIMLSLIIAFLAVIQVKIKSGNWPFSGEYSTELFINHFTSSSRLKAILLWGIVVILTQFMLRINDKFGQGLLWAFVSGKYRFPQEENRIFMFMDLNDSTMMAEKLGNEIYHNLISDFFKDITNPILDNDGRIYQYVGDEIIVSWEYNDEEASFDCINCFFDAKDAIKAKSDVYLGKYGLVPDFKAAIHYGKVTAGEIGIIKKELTYSGDVLNTASRIMAKCREYKESLLISGSVFSYLNLKSELYSFLKVGEEQLRGKGEKVEMYAVHK